MGVTSPPAPNSGGHADLSARLWFVVTWTVEHGFYHPSGERDHAAAKHGFTPCGARILRRSRKMVASETPGSTST
jgi:hypothetical protein